MSGSFIAERWRSSQKGYYRRRAPIGRVDIVLNKEGEALVSWIEEVEGEGEDSHCDSHEQGKRRK
ncbi:hypothetical protein [Okeania hirsuta]|nr:hypothetical protein [Okeania hirsuta]